MGASRRTTREPEDRTPQPDGPVAAPGQGNPVNTLPNSAISNCFPGLEFDFKNFWRRASSASSSWSRDNYVLDVEDEAFKGLKHHRLLTVDGRLLLATVTGPQIPGGGAGPLPSGSNPGLVTMEWSNSLSFIMQRQGHKVKCQFTSEESDSSQPIPDDPTKMLQVDLTVRRMFDGESVAFRRTSLSPVS